MLFGFGSKGLGDAALSIHLATLLVQSLRLYTWLYFRPHADLFVRIVSYWGKLQTDSVV